MILTSEATGSHYSPLLYSKGKLTRVVLFVFAVILLARASRAAEAWERIADVGIPSPRAYHTATWTGQEMIIWGGEGRSSRSQGDGNRYNPESDVGLACHN